MLRIEVDAAALGRVRFALSPPAVAWDALMLVAEGDARRRPRIGAKARSVLRERRLELLQACFNQRRPYLPDFPTPVPADYEDLDAELHQVATTSAGRVRAELDVLATTAAGGVPDQAASRSDLGRPVIGTDPAAWTLLQALDRGEEHLAARLAAELADFFRATLAPEWPKLRGRLESDIARRARDASRRGVGCVLADLHWCMVWDGDALILVRGPQGSMTAPSGVVLTPIAFHVVMAGGGIPPGLEPQSPQPPYLLYPAVNDDGGAARTAASEAHALIGVTRTVLLKDLNRPRTTRELARRHCLAESTVAYHLGILHRSGLATRVREGRNVLYQRSRQGATLLVSAD
ncbi:ArsR/SmtB family transcription factor [Catenulispora pinisilvae]|uniref:ArsR/SmtB family transcription factor n=1 Tax=Catenulispora pinisilvae TaxID=2705253 RepID=UPI001890C40E|nr:helix-turn-helix domain-containing protein [Catenulispora pinisilvae]